MSEFRNQQEERPKLSFYERGPGPAGYTLPTLVGRKKHAPTHRINPEYSMGLKLESSFLPSSIGPGPAEYKIAKGAKANGTFFGYRYTMRMKLPIIDKKFVPAPNLYKVPPLDKYRPKAPAFPFGSRTAIYNKRVSPAPNAYLLPRAIGPKIPDKLAAAECTLKGDRKSALPVISPGPIYNIGKPDLTQPKTPAFTMRIRWPDLSSSKYEAGPASYEGKLPPCSCKVPKGWHLGARYNDFTGIFRTPCDKALKYESLD